MHHLFAPEDDALVGLRVVLSSRSLDQAGGPETAFLDRLGAPVRQSPGFAPALAEALGDRSAEAVVLVRNPALVLDERLGERLAEARRRLAPLAGRWSIAAAGGLTVNGGRALALYASERPALPADLIAQPLLDPLPDLTVVDAAFLRELLARDPLLPETGFELILALEGWLAGRAALFLPELVAGVNGGLLPRDPVKLADDLAQRLGHRLAGTTVETLMGPFEVTAPPGPASRSPGAKAGPARSPRVPLEACIEETVTALADPLSLSIVTRTRFERPHLLRRLLASITRARGPVAALEVILSTDLPRRRAEAAFAPLEAAFPELELRLRVNRARGPSRVANLVGGIRAARHEYVAIVDDDDYLDILALGHAARALFLGARPLMVAETVVHEEHWVETAAGRHVLAHSAERSRYPAGGWRDMFTGVNRLPVSALVVPRQRLLARLAAFELRHDLSEDYALHLLLLTDPDLPAVVELPGPFTHVSIRPTERHSMTLKDRRPWTRDITLYLADLTRHARCAGPGVWQLLAGRAADHALREAPAPELRAALERQTRALALARREVDHLRRLLAELAGAHAASNRSRTAEAPPAPAAEANPRPSLVSAGARR